MKNILPSIICIIIASAANAVMDTITHHFYISIFSSLNHNFWNPEVSWKVAEKIPLTGYKLDAWHIFKSIMICAWAAAIILAPTMKKRKIIAFVIIGVIYNLIFNTFYNHLLLK